MRWVHRIAEELGAMAEAFGRIPEYTETADRLYHLLRNRTTIARDGSILSPLQGDRGRKPAERDLPVFPLPSLSRSR